MTKKEQAKTPEKNMWGLFGKVAAFIGGVVLGSVIAGDISGKHH